MARAEPAFSPLPRRCSATRRSGNRGRGPPLQGLDHPYVRCSGRGRRTRWAHTLGPCRGSAARKLAGVRLADLATDFWTLRSGEASHEQHPDRFWIPPIEERGGLRRGDAAKLIFDIEGFNPDGSVAVEGERMWVIVSEVVGNLFVGILDSQPACLDPESDAYLRFGVEVPFAPEHVIDIASPPEDYVEWQLGLAPERTWPR